MQDFFTWEMVGTFAGATLVCGLVTQAIKEIGLLKRLPTRALSWIIGLLVLTCTQLATGAFTPVNLPLTILNALGISLAANGGFDGITSLVCKAKG